MTPGLDSTLNVDLESWFNIKLWPGIGITIQCGFVTRGSWFNVEFWPGVIIQRGIVTPGHNSTLKCDPGSRFHVELLPGPRFHVEKLPRVLIPHWNMTLGLNSTLNCDPESWLNVELWPGLGVTIQCGFLTRGHNSTSTYLLPVELRLKMVSKFNSVIKIQQLRRVTIQRKIHWILTPGRYSIGGVKILSYRHTRFPVEIF